MNTKKEQLIEVDPSEDNRCPEVTKRYMLAKGYKPYRKESGKIKWINDSNRIYKNLRKNRENIFFRTNRFGQRKLRGWVNKIIYPLLVLLILYLIYYLTF